MNKIRYFLIFTLLLNVILGYMLFEERKKNTIIFNGIYDNLQSHLINTSSSIENYIKTNDKSYLNKTISNINAARAGVCQASCRIRGKKV